MNQQQLAREQVLARLGSQLHYWTTGPSGGPLVAFTHGATLDHAMFEAQIGPLVAAGYRTLTWDMRGHGRSKPMGGAFTVQTAAADLLAILDQLGDETATFIGHSFGGFVTQELTFRHPERVQALGVIGCTDLARKPALQMRLMAGLMPHILPRFSLETFRKRTVEHVSAREDVTRYAYDATGQLSKDEFLAVIMAGVVCLAEDAGFGPHYVIPKPFLLTHGERDSANNGLYPKSAPAWAKKEPHCTYQVIPGAGHTANQDNPAAFNAVLLDFLREQQSLPRTAL